MQDRHYYCVVFNLKSNLVEVIDNRHDASLGRDVADKCDRDVKMLQTMLSTHLKETNHSAGMVVEGLSKVRLVTSWQTRDNYVDCGVFVMRHMECYMGGGSRGFTTNLEREGPAQAKQLEGLRKKYTAKILFSEWNIRRDYVQSEIRRFYKMDNITQTQILGRANATRAKRLAKFG